MDEREVSYPIRLMFGSKWTFELIYEQEDGSVGILSVDYEDLAFRKGYFDRIHFIDDGESRIVWSVKHKPKTDEWRVKAILIRRDAQVPRAVSA